MSAAAISPLSYALGYAQTGWHVFPIRPPLFTGDGVRCSCRDGLDCPTIGKHPRTLWIKGDPDAPELWKRPATVDRDTITAWWRRWPSDNIGIATGRISGIMVVDVDKADGGWATIGRLDEQHGWAWSTARVLTPTGGGHFYYLCPPEGIPSSTAHGRSEGGKEDPLGPGVDIRGDGGMVVAPPSQHENGGRYAWQYELVPGGDRLVGRLP